MPVDFSIPSLVVYLRPWPFIPLFVAVQYLGGAVDLREINCGSPVREKDVLKSDYLSSQKSTMIEIKLKAFHYLKVAGIYESDM